MIIDSCDLRQSCLTPSHKQYRFNVNPASFYNLCKKNFERKGDNQERKKGKKGKQKTM